MKIIAHRGASHDAPENTLAAINLAWTQKADGVECDVQLTRDGQVVLLHDATTGRTAPVNQPIAHLTRAEAAQLDVGAWMGEAWAGEGIPALEEVLATVPPGKQLFIEIKCGREIIAPLARVVQQAGLAPEQVVLLGEFLDVLGPVRDAMPGHAAYWINNLRKLQHRARDPGLAAELAETAASAGLDGLGLRCMPWLDEPFVATVKKKGQHLFVWTVDDPVEARRMRRLGADSLATNRPGWLRERVGE